jgi:hypothetical protein
MHIPRNLFTIKDVGELEFRGTEGLRLPKNSRYKSGCHSHKLKEQSSDSIVAWLGTCIVSAQLASKFLAHPRGHLQKDVAMG